MGCYEERRILFCSLLSFLLTINLSFLIDEDDDQPRVLQLTNQHKAAIRAIRKVRTAGVVVVIRTEARGEGN